MSLLTVPFPPTSFPLVILGVHFPSPYSPFPIKVLDDRPRVMLQNAMGHIAPFTLRTLLYGDNLDLTVNKRIITETLRFIMLDF